MSDAHDNKAPIELSIDEVKKLAAAVASEMQNLGDGPFPVSLRNRFIDVRAALFQRGIYDPILVRFDSATVTTASSAEIAAELRSVADAL